MECHCLQVSQTATICLLQAQAHAGSQDTSEATFFLDPEAGLNPLFSPLQGGRNFHAQPNLESGKWPGLPSCLAAGVNGFSMPRAPYMSPGDESSSLSSVKALR